VESTALLMVFDLVGERLGEMGLQDGNVFLLLFIKLGLGGRYIGGLCYERLCVFGGHRLNVLFRKITGSRACARVADLENV
jgi:hypothetical protein